MAERTHAPTPKRLREARSKGDVPRAPLPAAALGLLAMAALVPGLVRALHARLTASLVGLDANAPVDAFQVAVPVITLVAPLVAALASIAVLAAVAQGAVTFSARPLAVDLARIDPVSGVARLFDLTRSFQAVRGVVVLVVGATLAWRAVLAAAAVGARAVGSPAASVSSAATSGERVVVAVGVVAMALAVLDVVVARRLHLGRLRMTRDEVMREHREGEGDPELKRRREELAHELLASQTLAAVRNATVVVVNPTHLACALRYERGGDDDDAPTLVAKGHGALAQRMIEAARAHGVPVVRDVPVAHALVQLEVGIAIPETLYEAVAEVLRAAWEGNET